MGIWSEHERAKKKERRTESERVRYRERGREKRGEQAVVLRALKCLMTEYRAPGLQV